MQIDTMNVVAAYVAGASAVLSTWQEGDITAPAAAACTLLKLSLSRMTEDGANETSDYELRDVLVRTKGLLEDEGVDVDSEEYGQIAGYEDARDILVEVSLELRLIVIKEARMTLLALDKYRVK